jgi:hypothetical protein
MIREPTRLTSMLVDRLATIEERVEKLRLSHGCAGDACRICAILDDIRAALEL